MNRYFEHSCKHHTETEGLAMNDLLHTSTLFSVTCPTSFERMSICDILNKGYL